MEPGATRVEIELEPADTKRSRRRAAPEVVPSVVLDAPTPSTAAPLDEALPPSGTPRNRLVVVALAVGLVALFLGWVLGRAGGGDGEAQTSGSATTSAVTPTTTPATSAVTDDTLPEAQLPTTTRPRPTTTTTIAPAWVEERVTLDPRLAGQADRVVAVGTYGALIELDLSTGSLRTLERSRPTVSQALPPIAGENWVVIVRDDGSPPSVFADGAVEGTKLTLFDAWSTLWDVDAGTYWERRWDERGRPNRVIYEMTLDGRPTGRSIDTHGVWARQIDPAGGLILGDGNVGTFRATPDGSQRLSDGAVIAVGINHVVAYACGENVDSCGMSVVDRATGDSQPVPIDDELAIELATTVGWWGPAPTAATINRDGSAAIFNRPGTSGQPVWLVLDLGSGSAVSGEDLVPTSTAYPSAAWSADGRFAYIVDRGSLIAVDHTTAEVFDVITDDAGPELSSFTLRPA